MSSPAPATQATERKSKIPKILTWSDPVRSGTVLGEILATLFVIRYGNLLRFTLRLTYWAIGVTGLLEFATRYFNGSKQGIVSSYRPSRFISINQHSLEKYTNRALGWLTEGLSEMKKLFDAEDLSDSLVAFVATLLMYILTGYVSVSTLAFIAAIFAFTVPRLYLQFQSEVDEAFAAAQKQADVHYQQVSKQVQQAAGPHVENARKQIGGVAGSIGLNLFNDRGGFPETPADKKTGPIADPSEIPGSPAKSGVDSVSEKAPKISTEARTIDGVTYDSVPTLAGNVDLKSKVDAVKESAKDTTSKTTESVPVSATNTEATGTTESSIEDLASDLKTSIANDKEQTGL